MFQRILVPLDGSSRAERALPVAARIARASGGSVHLLQVITHPIDAVAYFLQPPDETEHTLTLRHTKAADYLTRIATDSDALDGIPTTMEVADSIPMQTILSAARLQAIDLIVMCSHGETWLTHWTLGSVAQKVIRQSPVPVLVLPEKPKSSSAPPFQGSHVRILVGLDGSSLAETVLESAAFISAALSSPTSGALHLVQVVQLPLVEQANSQSLMNDEQATSDAHAYLQTVEQQLREGTLATLNLNVTSTVVVDPDVARTLLRVAENDLSSSENGTDEIFALATHGRIGTESWVRGSVTERVLGAMELPLLIV